MFRDAFPDSFWKFPVLPHPWLQPGRTEAILWMVAKSISHRLRNPQTMTPTDGFNHGFSGGANGFRPSRVGVPFLTCPFGTWKAKLNLLGPLPKKLAQGKTQRSDPVESLTELPKTPPSIDPIPSLGQHLGDIRLRLERDGDRKVPRPSTHQVGKSMKKEDLPTMKKHEMFRSTKQKKNQRRPHPSLPAPTSHVLILPGLLWGRVLFLDSRRVGS